MINELAAALNEIIAQAAPAAPEPTTEEAFAALLAGTTPTPPRRYRIRCTLTRCIIAFVGCVDEARDTVRAWNALAARPRYEVELA